MIIEKIFEYSLTRQRFSPQHYSKFVGILREYRLGQLPKTGEVLVILEKELACTLA